jgi:EAL domain-containing protein (putative c-di-GMP-specific phosphodiesterase class I)
MSLLDLVLQPGALSVRFQPIFDVRGETPAPHALECLIRGPQRTTLEAPDLLFEYARRKREEANVDRAAVATIAAAAGTLHPETRLHVNVHASTLGRDTSFVKFLRRVFESHAVELPRLVVEIVEHTDYVEEKAFLRSLDELRGAGCDIALDDVGSGRANFRMMLVSQPSLLKIDRVLVHGVAADPYRRAILGSLRKLADDFGIAIVVEGVEVRPDLDTVREIGVEFVQGYLLARPMSSAELLATPFGVARALEPVAVARVSA